MALLKRERNAETTREAILDAAEIIFAQHGFSGARIDAIADASTYNKRMIFQYFGDKAGLYRAVVQRIRQHGGAYLTQLLQPFAHAEMDATTLRHFLETLIRGDFDYLVAYPNVRAILAWEAAEGWQTFNAMPATDAEVGFNAVLKEIFVRVEASGQLHPALDPQQVILNALGLCLNYLAWLPRNLALTPEQALDSPEQLAQAREQIVLLVLHGALMQPVDALSQCPYPEPKR